jgi:hypothetical protein
VNYLHYIRIEKPSVRGYFRNDAHHLEFAFQKGDFIKLYVSKSDKDYNNVNIVTEGNETFFFDFFKTTRRLDAPERSFGVPFVAMENYYHILDVIPSPENDEAKPWWRFW